MDNRLFIYRIIKFAFHRIIKVKHTTREFTPSVGSIIKKTQTEYCCWQVLMWRGRRWSPINWRYLDKKKKRKKCLGFIPRCYSSFTFSRDKYDSVSNPPHSWENSVPRCVFTSFLCLIAYPREDDNLRKCIARLEYSFTYFAIREFRKDSIFFLLSEDLDCEKLSRLSSEITCLPFVYVPSIFSFVYFEWFLRTIARNVLHADCCIQWKYERVWKETTNLTGKRKQINLIYSVGLLSLVEYRGEIYLHYPSMKYWCEGSE